MSNPLYVTHVRKKKRLRSLLSRRRSKRTNKRQVNNQTQLAGSTPKSLLPAVTLGFLRTAATSLLVAVNLANYVSQKCIGLSTVVAMFATSATATRSAAALQRSTPPLCIALDICVCVVGVKCTTCGIWEPHSKLYYGWHCKPFECSILQLDCPGPTLHHLGRQRGLALAQAEREEPLERVVGRVQTEEP